MKGKIICINKYIHRVLLENNTIIDTRTRGKLRNQKVSPVVGDNVIVDINNKTIEKVEPRKNYLERPLIANIDKLLIVMSTSIPLSIRFCTHSSRFSGLTLCSSTATR